jgi:Spy/CpxP family protein refolding chaperone
MSILRPRAILAFLTMTGALLAGAGCNNAVQDAAEPTVETAQPVAEGEQEGGAHQRHRGPGARKGHGGPAMLLHAALRELSLSDAQKATIEKAIASLPAPPHAHGKDRDSHQAGRTALAQAVRAGKVDPDALPVPEKPDLAAMRASFASALGTLHQTLTPAQRQALVDALIKRMEERAPHGEHERGGRKEGRGLHGPLGFLTRDLNLTEQQREAIRKAMEAQRPDGDDHKARFERMLAERKARLVSFASDSFDAKQFTTPPADAPAMKYPGERMVRALAVVVPLLDAAQREKLAQRIEQGPGHRGEHHAPEMDGEPGDP